MNPAPDPDDHKGFAQIPRWLQRSKHVTPRAKLVYLALSSRADRHGHAHPSHALLAEEASCSIASVKRALEELQLLGVVSWEQRTRGALGRTSNVYTIGIAATETAPQGTAHRELNPVDNSPRREGGKAQPELGYSSHRATKERKPLNELTQSSQNPHQGAVENSTTTDDQSAPPTFPTPRSVFGTKHIDQQALAASVGHLFTESGISDAQLHTLAVGILGKASGAVADPTRYVVKAIRNEYWVYQQQAFDMVNADHAARVEAGGNQL